MICNKLGSPLERMHHSIIIEHREIPLALVHVLSEHKDGASSLRAGAAGCQCGERMFQACLVKDLFVIGYVLRNDLVRAVPLDRSFAAFLPKGTSQAFVFEQ